MPCKGWIVAEAPDDGQATVTQWGRSVGEGIFLYLKSLLHIMQDTPGGQAGQCPALGAFRAAPMWARSGKGELPRWRALASLSAVRLDDRAGATIALRGRRRRIKGAGVEQEQCLDNCEHFLTSFPLICFAPRKRKSGMKLLKQRFGSAVRRSFAEKEISCNTVGGLRISVNN